MCRMKITQYDLLSDIFALHIISDVSRWNVIRTCLLDDLYFSVRLFPARGWRGEGGTRLIFASIRYTKFTTRIYIPPREEQFPLKKKMSKPAVKNWNPICSVWTPGHFLKQFCVPRSSPCEFTAHIQDRRIKMALFMGTHRYATPNRGWPDKANEWYVRLSIFTEANSLLFFYITFVYYRT